MKKLKSQAPQAMTKEQDDAIDALLEAFLPVGEERYLPPEFPRELTQMPLARVPTERELKAAERSLYYWWWRFLKESPEYPPRGKDRQAGPIADLYRDFGTLGGDFRKWWTRTGRRVFSEPSGASVNVLYDSAWDSGDEDTAELLILTVFKNVPRRKIEADFRLLLKEHHPGAAMAEGDHKRAVRRLQPVERKQDKAFENVLKAWRLGNVPNPNWTEIGRKLPRNPGKKGRVNSISVAREEVKHLNKKAQAYFRRARILLHNAARGQFPKE